MPRRPNRSDKAPHRISAGIIATLPIMTAKSITSREIPTVAVPYATA